MVHLLNLLYVLYLDKSQWCGVVYGGLYPNDYSEK